MLVAASAAAALLLAGCTAPGTSAEGPAPEASASTPSPHNPVPNDGDESQDQWARLKTLVLAKYPDAEYSIVGSSARTTSFHLSAPKVAGTTGLAFAVSCTGGGGWRIRVVQENPQTVRGSCDGSNAPVPDAVPLDGFATGALIRVEPPKGVRFWCVAFYTKG